MKHLFLSLVDWFLLSGNRIRDISCGRSNTLLLTNSFTTNKAVVNDKILTITWMAGQVREAVVKVSGV